MRHSPRTAFMTIVPLLLSAALGCGLAVREFAFMGEAQGTTYSIKVIAPARGVDANRIESVIRARLDRIDQTFSLYRPDSEISRLNRLADTSPFHASVDLIEVLRIAAEISAASGGAFDVTVLPLVEAWGFGPHKREAAPSEDTITDARARVGYQMLIIDPQSSTVRKTQPDVACDLNAIAQGYTVDTLAADFEALGFTRYLIELGGEVKARGKDLLEIPWQVGIERPTPAGRGLQHTIPLNFQSLSTSGDYRRYRELNGRRVSHTIDPHTGYPITHSLASVCVIHQSCAIADAWATALMVLGPDRGYELAAERDLRALFIVHEADGRFAEKATPAFAPLLSR